MIGHFKTPGLVTTYIIPTMFGLIMVKSKSVARRFILYKHEPDRASVDTISGQALEDIRDSNILRSTALSIGNLYNSILCKPTALLTEILKPSFTQSICTLKRLPSSNLGSSFFCSFRGHVFDFFQLKTTCIAV